MRYVMQYLVIFSVISVLCWGQPSILDVAHAIQYYDRVRNLRNETIDHLLVLESIMKDKVHTLRATGHSRMADVKEQEYRDIYFKVSDDFDQTFDAFERRFILTGELLDDKDAPLDEKKALVASNLEGLTSAINYIITRYSPRSIT